MSKKYKKALLFLLLYAGLSVIGYTMVFQTLDYVFFVLKLAVLIFPLYVYAFSRLFKERRIVQFATFALLQIGVATFIDLIPLIFYDSSSFISLRVNENITEKQINFDSFHPLAAIFYGGIYGIFNFIFLLLFFAVKLFYDYIAEQVKKDQLEKDKQLIDLKYLRQQNSPHFLFNTLNNLYVLIAEDSKAAQKMVLTLSELMRFQVYDSQENRISIHKELQYIKNYVNLQSIRSRFELFYHDSGAQLGAEIKIPPFILFTLVENAFKHGNLLQENQGYLSIEVTMQNEEFNFIIENSVDEHHEQESKSGGFGHKTLKKLLKYSYPERHELYLRADDKNYRAHLKLFIT